MANSSHQLTSSGWTGIRNQYSVTVFKTTFRVVNFPRLSSRAAGLAATSQPLRVNKGRVGRGTATQGWTLALCPQLPHCRFLELGGCWKFLCLTIKASRTKAPATGTSCSTPKERAPISTVLPMHDVIWLRPVLGVAPPPEPLSETQVAFVDTGEVSAKADQSRSHLRLHLTSKHLKSRRQRECVCISLPVGKLSPVEQSQWLHGN